MPSPTNLPIMGNLLGNLFLLLAPALVKANTGSALWVQPSSKWIELDGTWSTFELNVGTPPQPVQLTVSTGLSETWVIGKGGCPNSNAICTRRRGNTFDGTASSTNAALGNVIYSLGLPTADIANTTGNYSLDTIALTNSLRNQTTSVDGGLIASVISNDIYTGYLGVGVVPGNFSGKLPLPLISQLAETYGTIPSHSYGYTAGAHYIQDGVPGSLVLGGYDPLRFVPHDNVFALYKTRMPQVRVRAINVFANEHTSLPSNWSGSGSRSLVTMNDSLTAFVDSSFPYLTLPQVICDRFADALNLTYNSQYDLYTFASSADASSAYAALQNNFFNFTFSLSSWDNANDFGQPLNMAGVVNITITGPAFAQLLSYPFKNSIKQDQSAVPYFPLRPAQNVQQIVIGRAFLQEAYIITKYDERVFSLHQALFPMNPTSNYSTIDIARAANSEFPAFVAPAEPNSTSLTPAVTAGIVISVVGVSAIVGLVLLYCSRKQRKKRVTTPSSDASGGGLGKDDGSTIHPDTPSSPLARLVSLLTTHATLTHTPRALEDGKISSPAELSSDKSHERFEMPAGPPPVELDATNDIITTGETNQSGTEDSGQSLSEYEITRRKLERQMQGPPPGYTSPTSPIASMAIRLGEDAKVEQDVISVARHRQEAENAPSPVSATSVLTGTVSLPVLSPTSTDSASPRSITVPSPMTDVLPSPYRSASSHDGYCPSLRGISELPDLGSITHSTSSLASPTHASGMDEPPSDKVLVPSSPKVLVLPAPPVQRRPINEDSIVCLGPMPENVRLPNQPPISRDQLFQKDGVPGAPPSPSQIEDGPGAPPNAVDDKFAVDDKTTGLQNPPSAAVNSDGGSAAPVISPVNVPQVANRRFSWESQ